MLCKVQLVLLCCWNPGCEILQMTSCLHMLPVSRGSAKLIYLSSVWKVFKSLRDISPLRFFPFPSCPVSHLAGKCSPLLRSKEILDRGLWGCSETLSRTLYSEWNYYIDNVALCPRADLQISVFDSSPFLTKYQGICEPKLFIARVEQFPGLWDWQVKVQIHSTAYS